MGPLYIGGITEALIMSTDFQQSLLITFDALIKARTEEKRCIIKSAYMNGYIPAEDREAFELERIYQVSHNISLDAVKYLRFLKKEIMPMYLADTQEQTEHQGIQEGGTVRAEPLSYSITKWIHINFNVAYLEREATQPYPTLNSDP